MRRPLGKALLLFLLGNFYIVYNKKSILAALIILFVLFTGEIFLSRTNTRKKISYLLLFMGLLFTGLIRTDIYTDSFSKRSAFLVEGKSALIEGRVIDIKSSEDSEKILLGNAFLVKEKGQAINLGKGYIYPDLEYDIKPGDRVLVRGHISIPKEATNFGAYDEEKQLNGQGISFKLYDVKVQDKKRPGISIKRFLYDLRCHLAAVYEKRLPGEEASMLSAMTLGQRQDVPEEVMDIMKLAGLAHLLSISGTHIDCLTRGLYKRLKRRGFGNAISSVAGIISAALYGTMCGNSVSTIRTVIMFGISLLAVNTGYAYDGISALLITASLMIYINPLLTMYSGFVFSFGIVAGVLLFSSPLVDLYDHMKREAFERKRKEGAEELYKTRDGRDKEIIIRPVYKETVFDKIIKQLIFAISIQIFSVPIVSFFYYEIPVYSSLINMILLPLFPLLLNAGLLGGLSGIIRIPGLDHVLLVACHYIIYFYESFADRINALPGAHLITGKPGAGWIIAFYLVLYAAYFCIKKISDNKYIFTAFSFSAAAALICMVSIRTVPDFEVDMLDVGQGDGIYISDGNGGSIFIDGGSTSKDQVGKYAIIPYLKARGIRKIDAWFVSHSDKDHISGLEEAIAYGYKIDRIFTSAQMTEEESFRNIKALAERRGIPVCGLSAGDIMESKKNGRVTSSIRVLSPDVSETDSDINRLSLVFLYKSGDFSGIFTGDIDSETEKKILDQYGDSLPDKITLYKACHHGSDGSNSREFMEALDPECIIISAGRNNRYNHPGKKALGRMRDADAEIYCTKWQGQISVNIKGQAETFLD